MARSNAAEDIQGSETSPAAVLARKFADHDISVPVKFTAGHVMSPEEAAWASSQFATVLGNAFGGLLRRKAEKKEALDGSPQAVFDEMVANYTFGVRGEGTSTASDPVSRLVNNLASEAVKALILRKGLKVKEFMSTKVEVDGKETSKFAQLVASYVEKHPELAETAKAQLAALSEDTAGDLDLTL